MPVTREILTRDFLLVTGASLVGIAGFSATLPLVPRYVESELGHGKVAVGVAVGIFSITALLVRPLIGYIGDNRGRRVLLVGGCVLSGMAVGAHALATTLLILLAIRAFMGATQAGLFVGSTTIVTDIAPAERRGQATSYFGVAIYGGQALGPIVGELVEEQAGFGAAFVVAGGLMVLAGVLARLLPPYSPTADPTPPEAETSTDRTDDPRPPTRRRLVHPAALPPGSVLAFGIVSFIAFTAFMPLYVQDRGLGRSAPVFVVYAITVLLVRFFASSFPDRFGTVRTATVALVGVALGMGTIWLWPTVAGLYVGTFIAALGGSMLFPALLVASVHGVADNERTLATSTFTAFFEISAGIGGPILGVIAALSGNRGAFAAAAASALIALPVLHLWTARTQQAVAGAASG